MTWHEALAAALIIVWLTIMLADWCWRGAIRRREQRSLPWLQDQDL